MVSLFGESDTDRRDYGMGLAGLTAGVHALRILAERGIASPQDVRVSMAGVVSVLETIPSDQFQPGMFDTLKAMLHRIEDAAAANFGKKS